jgi:hypothetical protein
MSIRVAGGQWESEKHVTHGQKLDHGPFRQDVNKSMKDYLVDQE